MADGGADRAPFSVNSPGYRPQLDSLRAFAVTAVLLTHFWLINSDFGPLGVRLFFVLSGFLLTTILIRERAAAEQSAITRRQVLTNFYVRRALRIWPAYYAVLIAAVLLGADELQKTFAWHALFATNILFFRMQEWYTSVASHLWTLSVEEQFYLLLPVVVLFVRARWFIPVLIVSILAAVAFRTVVGLTVPGPLDFYVVLPVAQLDALGGGALLAVAIERGIRVDWRQMLAWSAPLAMLAYLAPLPAALAFGLGQALFLLPMIAVIAGANEGIGGRPGQLLSWRPLVALGRISYGVYLYHLFGAAGVNRMAHLVGYRDEPGPLSFALMFCVTIAVAAMSWFAIERPALSLRRHFGRADQAPAMVPAAPTR